MKTYYFAVITARGFTKVIHAAREEMSGFFDSSGVVIRKFDYEESAKKFLMLDHTKKIIKAKKSAAKKHDARKKKRRRKKKRQNTLEWSSINRGDDGWWRFRNTNSPYYNDIKKKLRSKKLTK